MQQLDLELAGEFFVMAASLMEIKSRMLLPKGEAAIDPNADDEEVDPRWELVHQLIQYKKFKEAAAQLDELSRLRQDRMERYVESVSLRHDERPLKSVDRIELWNTFNLVLRRLAEKLVVGEIQDEQVTVADQMEWLLLRARTESISCSRNFSPGKSPCARSSRLFSRCSSWPASRSCVSSRMKHSRILASPWSRKTRLKPRLCPAR